MSNPKYPVSPVIREPHERHGGPYDRGSADRYYGRGYHPHYYVGATYSTARVEKEAMTEEEIAEYKRGYEEQYDTKDWGDPDTGGDDDSDDGDYD